MKAVGEVMGIGSTFIEALQKATQSLETSRNGLGSDGHQLRNLEAIMDSLEMPNEDRLFHIKDAFDLGVPLESVRRATGIDKWFLQQIQELVEVETQLKRYELSNIPKEFFLTLKQKGYSDNQIAWLLGNVTENEVYDRRMELGLKRVFKMVDTCAGEFPAYTPYFYSTFDEENESIVSDTQQIIVLV